MSGAVWKSLITFAVSNFKVQEYVLSRWKCNIKGLRAYSNITKKRDNYSRLCKNEGLRGVLRVLERGMVFELHSNLYTCFCGGSNLPWWRDVDGWGPYGHMIAAYWSGRDIQAVLSTIPPRRPLDRAYVVAPEGVCVRCPGINSLHLSSWFDLLSPPHWLLDGTIHSVSRSATDGEGTKPPFLVWSDVTCTGWSQGPECNSWRNIWKLLNTWMKLNYLQIGSNSSF